MVSPSCWRVRSACIAPSACIYGRPFSNTTSEGLTCSSSSGGCARAPPAMAANSSAAPATIRILPARMTFLPGGFRHRLGYRPGASAHRWQQPSRSMGDRPCRCAPSRCAVAASIGGHAMARINGCAEGLMAVAAAIGPRAQSGRSLPAALIAALGRCRVPANAQRDAAILRFARLSARAVPDRFERIARTAHRSARVVAQAPAIDAQHLEQPHVSGHRRHARARPVPVVRA